MSGCGGKNFVGRLARDKRPYGRARGYCREIALRVRTVRHTAQNTSVLAAAAFAIK